MSRRNSDSNMTSKPPEHHKVVLIGDSTVGKTQLIARLTKNSFDAQGSTRGIEVSSKTISVNHSPVKVQVWDTCGQEQFRCVSAPYFRGASGALAVFDLTRANTLPSLRSWIEEVRSKAASNVQIVLVGAKDDLEAERQVSLAEAQSFAASEALDYIETSALSGHNVEAAFALVMKKVVAVGGLGRSLNSISLSSIPDKPKVKCKC